MPDEPRSVVLWRLAEPAAFAGRIAALGLPVGQEPRGDGRASGRWVIGLGSAVLVLEDAADAPSMVAVIGGPRRDARSAGAGFGRREAPAPDHPRAMLVALGWATVDLERAARARPIGAGPRAAGSAIETVGGPPTLLPEDGALGARAALLPVADPPAVVLLEPLREGRLAASLARFGEGPCVLYISLEAVAGPPSALEPTSDGPFGRQRLLAGGPPWGPHLFVVLDALAPDPRVGHEPLPSAP